MNQLQNLEGIKAKKVDCDFIYKVADIKRLIDKGLAATMAGANGAINIWKDDTGKIRCEFMQYYKAIDTQIFDTITQVNKWFSVWRKKAK